MNEIHKRAVGQSHAGASSLDNRPQGVSDSSVDGRSPRPPTDEKSELSVGDQATRASQILPVMLVVVALLTSAAMVSIIVGRVMYDADARMEDVWRHPYLDSAWPVGENATWIKYNDWVDGHGRYDRFSSRNPVIFALLDEGGQFIHDGMMVPFPNGQDSNPFPITRGAFTLHDDLYVLVIEGDSAPYGRTGTVRINASSGEVVGPLWNIDWPLLIDVETATAVSGDTVHMVARNVTHGLTSAAEYCVYYTRSEDPAVNWSAPVGILSKTFRPYRVNIAVDGADKVAVAVSATNFSSDGSMDMDLLIWSHDGGRSWDEPVNVTGDPIPHGDIYRSYMAILPNGTSILCFDTDEEDLSPELFMISPSGLRVRLAFPNEGVYHDLKMWIEPNGRDEAAEVRALLTDRYGLMGYEVRLGPAGVYETAFPVSRFVASGLWIDQSDESIRSLSVVDDYSWLGSVDDAQGECILLETNRSTGEERLIGKPYEIVWDHTYHEDMDYEARTSRYIGYTWILVVALMAIVLMVVASRKTPLMGRGHLGHKRIARAVGFIGISILAMFAVTYVFIDQDGNRQYYSFYIIYMLMGIFLIEMLAMASRRWSTVRLLHLIFIPFLMMSVIEFALHSVETEWDLDDFLCFPTILCLCILLLAIDLALIKVVYGLGGPRHPLKESRVVRLLPIVFFFLIVLMPIVLVLAYQIRL